MKGPAGLDPGDAYFDFDTPVDRRDTASLKWDRYEGQDVIPLWVADMDFRSPPAVIEALHRRVAHGVFGYTHAPAGLEEAVLASLLAEYDWKVEREWIVWLPGLVSGLNVLSRAVGVRGDEVVTFTPIYPPFLSAPALAERSTVRVPLVVNAGHWEMDLEALERSLTTKSRLLLLCSPHNPVGRAWSEEELRMLVEVAERHDLVIGSDEIHAGLVLDEDKTHIPVATLSPAAAARTITLLAPSKTFNVPAGLLARGHPRSRSAYGVHESDGGDRPPRQCARLHCGSGRLRSRSGLAPGSPRLPAWQPGHGGIRDRIYAGTPDDPC